MRGTHASDLFVAELVRLKSHCRLAVCLYGAPGVGDLRSAVVSCEGLVDRGMIDQVIVVDESPGGLAAGNSNTEVVSSPRRAGVGAALRESLSALWADAVILLDTSHPGLGPSLIASLAEPLLLRSEIQLVLSGHPNVLGPLRVGESGAPRLPGHSCELELAGGCFRPITGRSVLRQEALEHLRLADRNDVEVGLLMDINRIYGPGSIAVVELVDYPRSAWRRHKAIGAGPTMSRDQPAPTHRPTPSARTIPRTLSGLSLSDGGRPEHNHQPGGNRP